MALIVKFEMPGGMWDYYEFDTMMQAARFASIHEYKVRLVGETSVQLRKDLENTTKAVKKLDHNE